MKRLHFPHFLHFGQFSAIWPCVCVHVCAIHQHVKLMLHIVQSHVPELTTYHNCLAKTMCNPQLPSCCLGECPVCPDTHLSKEELVASIEKSDLYEIIFKQCVSRFVASKLRRGGRSLLSESGL